MYEKELKGIKLGLKGKQDACLYLIFLTTSMQMSEVEIEANHSPGHSVEFINKANRKQVLSTAGYFVHLASQTASVSFEIAKSSTKFGIGVGRTIVHELGAYTGLELPSAILSSTLSVAEFIAITSIETSRFWTDFGIGTAKFNVHLF